MLYSGCLQETYSLTLHTRNMHDALDRIHSPVKQSATNQACAASLQLLIVSDFLRRRVGNALLSKIRNIHPPFSARFRRGT